MIAGSNLDPSGTQEAVADPPCLTVCDEAGVAGQQQEARLARPIWEELSDEGYDRFMQGLL